MANTELKVIVKAKELAVHSFKLTSNANRYPKKYRHSLCDKIQIKSLELFGIGEKLWIDFSVVNDMKYYNGLAFKGFVEGIPSGILSGGQYDSLMQKMKKKSQAIGFAVYLDELSKLSVINK